MKILEPEFSHSDNRRKLTQLLTAPIEQVNVYEIKEGSILGNHFHKETTEYFYVTRGILRVKIGANEFVATKGSLFSAEPLEVHTVEAVSDSSLITFLDHAYTEANPDIWKS